MKQVAIAMILFFCPLLSFSQNYYFGRDTISYMNTVYKVKHFSYSPSIIIRNDATHVLDSMIYKVGSCPREYYSFRTGYPVARPIPERIDSVVQQVFTEEQILLYTQHPGYIEILFALNPADSSVLDVEYFIKLKNSEDYTIFSVPVEKFYLLETKLKQIQPCFIPVDVFDAQMSYCTALYAIFLSPPTH